MKYTVKYSIITTAVLLFVVLAMALPEAVMAVESEDTPRSLTIVRKRKPRRSHLDAGRVQIGATLGALTTSWRDADRFGEIKTTGDSKSDSFGTGARLSAYVGVSLGGPFHLVLGGATSSQYSTLEYNEGMTLLEQKLSEKSLFLEPLVYLSFLGEDFDRLFIGPHLAFVHHDLSWEKTTLIPSYTSSTWSFSAGPTLGGDIPTDSILTLGAQLTYLFHPRLIMPNSYGFQSVAIPARSDWHFLVTAKLWFD